MVAVPRHEPTTGSVRLCAVPPATVTAGPSAEHSTIAMDNKLERLGANAVFRSLPLDSTLALRGVYTKVTNSFPIFPTFLSISGTTG